MSTFYAAFIDSAAAQRAATDLMEEGLGYDDLSVLAHESFGDLHWGERSSTDVAPPVQDASYIVGASDDPENRPSVQMEKPPLREDFFEESPVSGGISTAQPEDSISSVDEADESQQLSEEGTYPFQSQGRREVMDLERAIITGFPTDVPRIDDFQPTAQPDEDLDKSLETIIVPGFGVVMGGGELATAALALGGESKELKPVYDHLQEAGVEVETAGELIKTFEDGGAILSVELANGSTEAIHLEEWAERVGALIALTADGPRYHVYDQSE